jgi:hypothetical protein
MSGGAFGNMLLMFPETKILVDYFDMQPLNGAGYGPRTDIAKVPGILQCTTGRRVKTASGNKIIGRGMRFWTETQLQAGRFISDGVYVYSLAIPSQDDWNSEAGFYIYDVERVTGQDGTEIVEPSFTHGLGQLA